MTTAGDDGGEHAVFGMVGVSTCVTRTLNPIRNVVQSLTIPKDSEEKKLIPLSIGDPTVFGNLRAPPVFVKAVQDAVANCSNHGYKHSMGTMEARTAVANYQSKVSGRAVEARQVCLTSGCSGALEIAIKVLCHEGDNILLPQPGFSLYETIARSNGIDVRFYDLDPARQWEVDLTSMAALIDSNTKAIVVNNPSNPCGSVFSEQHLRDILQVASQHKVPIISDEIYADLVFKGNKYVALASLTRTVPILEVGGIAKVFIVPGSRIGWVVTHDAPTVDGKSAFELIIKGVETLSQLLVGPNTIMQAALPAILDPTRGSPEEEEIANFRSATLVQLENNAAFLAERLKKIRGFNVIVPQGAMYVMIGLTEELRKCKSPPLDDVAFTNLLLEEELVFVLPGSAFNMDNYIRIVFCAPESVLEEACNRIERCCAKLLA